ncbi:MAG: efflux RND transporter permease subunit [Proteiniphilum sp.]|jgi:HAE1 family hydrophobic/amphiphilic exporter-1|nr:efflux RND transporter permease subunit [Proteiniphilum sp.]HHT34361.1 efflux RND transporter permease subunit [Bacteroidales bacterium]MDD2727309.1 efflux RND transporter permease subunit [Proteiniphilum sp.]MDD3332464.1 efflux RND transporter permease subunit [Proteiniphilum sp.]MDD3555433.1 efflux RND transporter permease subunit [Proteiniphilum sp.]
MKPYETAVKNPVGTALIFIGVVLIGILFYRQLPIDLYPNIDLNIVSVMTSYSGAGAEDVEANVTRPLEDVLNSTEKLKEITSQSKDGMSMIMLEFEFGTDMDEVMNDVRDKVDMIAGFLPDGTEDPMILKFSSDMIPVVVLSATAEESAGALYKILDEQVANPLNRIPGIGTVSVSGAPEREVQVNVAPQKLEAYNLSLEQIAQVIATENVNVPAGNFDIGSQTYMLRLEGQFKNSRELNDIIVGSSQGKPIYLRDVATVSDTLESRVQENYTNGVRSASIVVQKQSGANTVSIANAVKAQLPELEKTLPPDIKLVTVMDTSEYVKVSINSLLETILLALLIVGVIVLFFLGRWRATIIVMVTIPISLIGSFIYLYLTGNTINIISLSALSITIGMVVDDAIVVLENITSHIERGSRPRQAAVYGTEEVSLSVIASTLTIIAVFLPMTMVGGFAGVMFKQLGWMVTIIISLSLVIALTLTPMMSARMMRGNKDIKMNGFDRWYSKRVLPLLNRLDHRYSRLVNRVARRRRFTIFAVLVIFVVSVVISAVTLKTEFMPASDNNDIALTVEMPTGTRMEVARETGHRIAQTMETKYPEIEIISFSVGSASEDNAWAAMQDNASNIMTYTIRLTESKNRKKSIYDVSDEMRQDLAAMPEVRRFQVMPGGGDMGMTGGSNVALEIFGYDLSVTDEVAAELQERMEEVKGLRDITVSRKDYRMEYQIQFDREKLSLNGLNMSTAANAIRNRINGLTMSQYREEGEEYNIRVRYEEQYRQSIEDIENIMIYNPMGGGVRVRDLGAVVETSTLPQVDRQDRQRIVSVTGSIYGRALSEVVDDVSSLLAEYDVPPGVQIVIGGSMEEQQESFGQLGLLLMIVSLLVYIVLASQFESLTYPFMIILTVPFAFTGSILLLALTGEPLGIMGFVGLIMLVGMVVKNAIVLIDYINLNRERGMSIITAVVHGGRSRLRPVLMTTLTTILGMVPLAIGTGQGSEMWKSLGISIIGGMTFSTIITLVLIPALYSMMAGYGVRRRRRKHREVLVNNQSK